MKVEAFQFKYTAEEMQQLFDHMNNKHDKIDTNAEEIENIKEQLKSIDPSQSYTEEELRSAILDIIAEINSEEDAESGEE